MPDHPVALAILQQVGAPIVGTSANPSGTPPTKDLAQIHEWFDGRVGAIVDAPCGPHSAPSTVIDLSARVPVIVREGSIPLSELRELLPDVTIGPQR
jgi:L-threonylcarbamoyladenylate synthase